MVGENKEAIYNIHPFVSRMPHAVVAGNRRLLDGNATLGRPAVHPNEKHVVVGTQNAGDAQSLILVDTERFDSMLDNPVVSQLALNKGVITSQWVGANRLLAFTGTKEDAPTTVQIYRVDVGGTGEFKLEESLVVNDAIREVAAHPTLREMGVYGGAENKLSVCDFSVSLQPTRTMLTDSGVASVRWAPYHNYNVVSCTTEEGQVCLYDVKTQNEKPVWKYKGDMAIHKAMYTHCQVTEFQLILGFEDNFMEAIDIRMPQNGLNNHMTGAFDPFCHMIGDMHYRESSGFLLVSGMADFSVYKHYRSGAQKGVAQLWCHSVGSQNTTKDDFGTVFNCAFLKDNWVICAAESSLNLFKLE